MDAREQTGVIPEPQELIRRAREMVPRLAARSARAEAERRLPAETVAEMQAAGFFRVLQPKRWGGYEMHPGVYYDILMTLAEGCFSTAWVYGVVGIHPWIMALYDERAAEEVWGKDRATLISSSLMPGGQAVPAAGGFRLTGRWLYSSGCDHCNWALLGGVVAAADPTAFDWRFFLVPRAQYQIVDTWNVSGLKGTGSQDVVVEDAFVPAHRAHKVLDFYQCVGPGQALNTGALYRIPAAQILYLGVACGAIGALQGMVGAFLDYGRSRATVRGKTVDDPFAQLACAEAAATVDELKLVLHRNLRNLMDFAERGEVPPLAERVRYKFQSAWGVERCGQAALRLFKASGAHGLRSDLPFGRILADLNAGRQHVSNQPEYFGRAWGTMLLGGPEPAELMV
ncbi:MAG TPA: acyl-CoA dehydrogenase family protein [Stellaceae bacterium]|nr:acyl-CoA dehydrogenase family protein [Stellaceae bacterium]